MTDETDILIIDAPIEDTLYFAGEATNIFGHHGTVHGAIQSALRAAITMRVNRDRSTRRGGV